MKHDDMDLLHRYLDGAITADELKSLENLLRTNPEARATLRSLATIDSKWQQLADQQALIAVDGSSSSPRSVGRRIPLWVTVSVMAASLIVGAIGWFRGGEDKTPGAQQGIARVIRVEGKGAAADGKAIDGGMELYAGAELDMRQGLIELAFRETGVHVIATAPLRLNLKSDQHVALREGQIKLVVPPQGVGFVVDTAQRKFVDLGTSFVVTATEKGSEVLVLDGQVSVDSYDGVSEDLMHEGDFARFDRKGRIEKRTPSDLSRAMPELSLGVTRLGDNSLRGMILGYDRSTSISKSKMSDDKIGQDLLQLIRSGFQDRACIKKFKQGKPLSFRGIAGAYHRFPKGSGLMPYSPEGGWMTWFQGRVIPPQSGRYRFWGYADNHLLVAINGKPVFEGSRRGASFKDLGIPRTDNPSLPCLIASAGFACSDWIELSGEPVQLDLLFGEVGGNMTSGLLLIEREGETYEETFWGQPKWPLFLTESPDAKEAAELKRLVEHLERKTMGSFSVVEEAFWKLAR